MRQEREQSCRKTPGKDVVPKLSRRTRAGYARKCFRPPGERCAHGARGRDRVALRQQSGAADPSLNIRAQQAADQVRDKTSGRVEIKILPNNQLGGDTAMLSQVRNGGITFFTPSALPIAKVDLHAFETIWDNGFRRSDESF